MGADLRNNGQFISVGDPALVNEVDDAANFSPFIRGQIGHVTAITRTAYPTLPRMFQYVLRASADATTAAAGKLAFWVDYDDFTITMDASASFDGAGSNHVAGVFLGALPSAGYFGYIQVAGIADVFIKQTPTTAATTAGLPVVHSAGTDGLADVLVAYDSTTAARTVEIIAKTIEANAGNAASECILLIDRVGW